MATFDLTNDKWFHRRKSSYHGNLLFEIVENFEWLQATGQNTIENLHFIGGLHLDNPSGYYLNWDGRHVCDRCGTIIEPNGYTKSVQMAYAMKVMPRLKYLCICLNCESELERERKEDSLYFKNLPKPFCWSKPVMPNDWDKYVWL